jgi:hypothetical protein
MRQRHGVEAAGRKGDLAQVALMSFESQALTRGPHRCRTEVHAYSMPPAERAHQIQVMPRSATNIE